MRLGGIALFGLILLLASSLSGAESFAPQAGDRIVWGGDSITHQCKYTQYVENFLYTRYHDKRLRFFNSGIKGDSARDLLDRFEEDLAFFKPRYVTLLLGMNDGRYRGYEADNYALYQADMSEILDRLKALEATPVILSPTLFDHQQYDLRNQEPDFRFKRLTPHPDYNAKLGLYGGWLRKVATVRSLPYVDLWGPMNDLTDRFRQSSPEATLAPDSIHPNPDGMALMAVRMVRFFAGERCETSSASIIREGGAIRTEGKVRVETFTENSLKARVTPTALPWVLPATGKMGPAPWNHIDDPREGFAAAMEGLGLNEDRLQVRGLAPGEYDIFMNGKLVDTVDHYALGAGVALQNNPRNPAYQQSMELALLNARRNDEGVRPYRDAQGKMKGARKKNDGDPQALARFRAELQGELDRLLRHAEALEDRIHELAIPKAYDLEIRVAK